MVRLLQHYTENFQPLIQISKPIHQEYCDKHGYEFHLKQVPQYQKYDGLEKLNHILEVGQDDDILMVMDADAIITNLLIKVERFIEDGADFSFSEGMNCGIFIVRMTHYSKRHINQIIESISSGQFNCEQDAFENKVKYIPGYHVNISKHPSFNSYLSELYPEVPQPVTEEQGQWIEGSFICHLPALGLQTRIEKMKELTEKIVR